ncbi:parallel beta-helix repeat protein [Labrenzia sp. EL_208]|nr:parallel beta-helix repeat protein [Labrenzia sp. EL_208]
MGSVGDAYDNAMCESFFATLACELFDRRKFQTKAEARMAIFEFIEGWYNPARRHSALGYQSPIAYERSTAEELESDGELTSTNRGNSIKPTFNSSLIVFSEVQSFERQIMSNNLLSVTENSINTFTASSAEELMKLLESASGGETILLTDGDYHTIELKGLNFTSNVTIKADEGANVIVSDLNIYSSSNITVDSIYFEYEPVHNPNQSEKPFAIISSSNIVVKKSVFASAHASSEDPTADGFGTGIGLLVTDSDGVTVENNEFYNWYRGAFYLDTTQLTVTNNDVHDNRSDGFNFSGVSDVLIEGNHLHDFHISETSADHTDFVQFWTTGSDTPMKNITIRNNVLETGDGDPAQGIFMRNEEVDNKRAGGEMFYENIVIENNIILAEQPHGIYVGQANGVNIEHNILIDSSDGEYSWVPAIRVHAESTAVVVEENIANRILVDGGLIAGTNAIVQTTNPNGENYLDSASLIELINQKLSTGAAAEPMSPQPTNPDVSSEVEVTDPTPPSQVVTVVQILNTSSNKLFEATHATERFSFHGGRVKNGEKDVIQNIDFAVGDTIGFSGYESGFFQSDDSQFLNIFARGGGAIVASNADLVELSKSNQVQLSSADDDSVVLSIGTEKVHTLVLEGLSYSELRDEFGLDQTDNTERANLDTSEGHWKVMAGSDTNGRYLNTSVKDVFSGGGGADRFSFHGQQISENDKNVITDLDFSEGDSIGFSKFESGFFDGNGLGSFAGASGAIIDSEADLKALALMDSVDVFETGNGSVILDIHGSELLTIALGGVSIDMFA